METEPVYQPKSQDEAAHWVSHSFSLTESTWIPSKWNSGMCYEHILAHRKRLIGIRALWASPCTESWTCQRQMCCLCSFLDFSFGLKPHSLDGTANMSVLCSLLLDVTFQDFWVLMFLKRYLSLESAAADVWSSGLKPNFPVFKFWIIGNTAFWKMNLISFWKPLWKSGIITTQFPNSYQFVFSRKASFF